LVKECVPAKVECTESTTPVVAPLLYRFKRCHDLLIKEISNAQAMKGPSSFKPLDTKLLNRTQAEV
jgi:hypothetical protein